MTTRSWQRISSKLAVISIIVMLLLSIFIWAAARDGIFSNSNHFSDSSHVQHHSRPHDGHHSHHQHHQHQPQSTNSVGKWTSYKHFILQKKVIMTSRGSKSGNKYRSRNMTEITIFWHFCHIQSNRHKFYELKRADIITLLVIRTTQLKTHFKSIIYWAAKRKSVIFRDFDSFKIH